MRLKQETIIAKHNRSLHYFHLQKEAFAPFWHYHEALELTFIQKGRGSRFVGDHIGSFYDRDLVLLGENLPHHWVSDIHLEASPQEAYVIQFSKSIFQEFTEFKDALQLFDLAKRGIHYTQPTDLIIEKITTLDQHTPFKQMIVFYEIIEQLLLDQQRVVLSDTLPSIPQFQEHQKDKISSVLSYILKHIDDAIHLEEISAYTGMTPPAFCRWFKKSIGKSFVQYLHSIRIEKACQLLLLTDYHISEIAFQAGFESIQNFNRIFKKIKGISPKAYRKAHFSPM